MSEKKGTTKNSTTAKVSPKTNKIKAVTKKTNTISKKTASKKTQSIKKSSLKETTTKNSTVLEYYDLPYGYNQTVVKILAQTPNTLFVYWDISSENRNQYMQEFGNDFFETTKPILIVHNKTKNYSFEVEINDFANSWYLHINDANSVYEIELGRRYINKPEKYLQVAYSNTIEAPNDHILFEEQQEAVFFANVETHEVTSKNIANLHFVKRIGKIYNIYDLYSKLYKHENLQEISNPSSNF